MERRLPSGTVTLLFTDIEGSTRLLQELGRERYVRALTEHRRLLREAFAVHGGVEVEMQGDSFHFAFASARGAVEAAQAAQRALLEHEWEAAPMRVRMGLHTGRPTQVEGLYAGLDVHAAARVMSAGHGGQVLLSETTREALGEELLGLGLQDLGEHRLKDLPAPLRLYQLVGEGLRAEFPPLRTLYRATLPFPATPFLGRERELAELTALLAREEVRLLTLTGPGGSGKTRLALKAAAAVSGRFPDGVFWVSLAGLREPELLLPNIARALGVEGKLSDEIGDRRLLLLLDNFEQLVEAAPQLSPLLGACPNLRLLVTSREPLRLSGEHTYLVPPLQEADAVALFRERARAVAGESAGDGQIAEICRRLDHLPLAIELAAARAGVLSPPALLQRLERRLPLLTGGPRDVPERQRTLEATIAWSHEFLTLEEQRLFASLSVFAGGCTLEAAEEICDAELDTLQSLVEKSLLVRGGGRFRMLETIREYAADRLGRRGASEILRERQATYFLALAEQAEQGLEGRERVAWLGRLEDERDNLRAALDWANAAEAAELELRLATALRDFWSARGPLTEGLSHLERALARAGDRLPERRLEALAAAALAALSLDDPEAAAKFARELLELARRLGDKKSEVSALIKLSHAATDSGRAERARSLMETALATARDPRLRAIALLNLARARVGLGDLVGGTEAAHEALELSLGQADDAIVADALVVLAAADAQRDPKRAATLFGAADALRDRVGAEPDPLDQQAVEVVREAIDRATYGQAYMEGGVLSLEEAVSLARGRSPAER